jgi:hypothetical protein
MQGVRYGILILEDGGGTTSLALHDVKYYDHIVQRAEMGGITPFGFPVNLVRWESTGC